MSCTAYSRAYHPNSGVQWSVGWRNVGEGRGIVGRTAYRREKKEMEKGRGPQKVAMGERVERSQGEEKSDQREGKKKKNRASRRGKNGVKSWRERNVEVG